MNETIQVITFLLNALQQKDSVITELQKQLAEAQKKLTATTTSS